MGLTATPVGGESGRNAGDHAEPARTCDRNGRGQGESQRSEHDEAPPSESFAHLCDRGKMRRTYLRGLENVTKSYLMRVAGHNLSVIMRKLVGIGKPRRLQGLSHAFLRVLACSFFMLGLCFEQSSDLTLPSRSQR